MIRKAKHSSAANFGGSGLLGSVFGRRAFATRAASPGADGSGASSHSPALGNRSRFALALVAALILALALAPAAFSTDRAQTSTFDGADSDAGAFSGLGRLAIHQATGTVYAIDNTGSGGVVDKFDSSGAAQDFSALGSSSLSGADVTAPDGPVSFDLGFDSDLAVDNSGTASDGRLYVLEEYGSSPHTAFAFDAAGNYLHKIDVGAASDACGIAVDSAGHIWIADYESESVIEYDASGAPTGNSIDTSGQGHPCHLAFDSADNLYVALYGGALQKYDSTGAFQGEIDPDPTSAVAIDPTHDHVFAVHSDRVSEYDSAGAAISEFGLGDLSSAVGAAVNPANGDAFVADPGDNKVHVFTLFGGPTHTLDVAKTGTGTGTVTSAPAGIACGADCSQDYSEGKVVVLTALADSPSSAFSGWSGCDSTAGNECTVTVTADTTVTASFSLLPQHTLDVAKTGTGTGTVTSAPAGIACGADCTENYFEGQQIVLTALADFPSRFGGWSGCDSTAGNECTVAVTADTVVTASFLPPPEPPLAATDGSSAGPNDSLRTLEGHVNPGGAPTTDCRFVYGTTAEYGQSAPCLQTGVQIGAGNADVAVSATTEPLEPDTTYHFRLRVSNTGGSGQGGDRTFTTSPAPADGCPNAAIRAEQGVEALQLPDCMALEMVSPPKKGNQLAREPSAISADNKRILFRSRATVDNTPNVDTLNGNLFIATRGASGWASGGANAPLAAVENTESQQQSSFSPDLSRWFVLSSRFLFGRYYQRQVDGIFSPFSPPLVNLTGLSNPQFQGASADRSHLYFKPDGERTGSFLPGDPVPAGEGEDPNLYVAQLDSGGDPSLALLARDRDGKVWGANCGARLGGMEGTTGQNLNLPNGLRNQGAISVDGSRVYFSTRPTQPPTGNCTAAKKKRILQRLETPSGPEIGELVQNECTRVSPPCSSADGDDLYQGASVDQTKVYFTTNRQLADTDLDGSGASCVGNEAPPNNFNPVAGCDLYLYDATKPEGERLTQVSAGDATDPTPGSGANVINSIAAISADGSHVYFAAGGVLTTHPNPEGDVATAGQPNFYAWDATTGATAFIGTLAGNDGGFGFLASGLWGSEGTWRNGAYPVPILGNDAEGHTLGGDGHLLFFKSRAPLTADDGDGAFRDLFRYDAAANPPTLTCVSCAPGGVDDGAFDVELDVFRNTVLGTDYAELGRSISEDGETVAFATAEPLLPGDVNGVEDVYMRSHGQLYRLPGSARASTKLRRNTPIVSEDGSMVAYHGTAQLLSSDGDSAQDVYVARVDGGFPNVVPAVCTPDGGEGCQGPAGSPPANQGAAACAAAACGNVVERPKCRKGFVRKHGNCVKKHHRRKRHHRDSLHRAGANRGTGR